MPTANQLFRQNPIKFMKANLVIAPSGCMVPGVRRATLVKQNNFTCKTKLGTAWGKKLIDAYCLDLTNNEDNSFEIYWLPYADGKLFHMTLDDAARYMFTPPMDGCTFSYGGQYADRPIVAHANFTKSGEIDQGKIDNSLSDLYTPQIMYSALTKQDYTSSKHFASGSGNVSSTTFGVFANNVWNFYSQKYEKYHRAVAQKQNLLDNPDDTPEWNSAYAASSNYYELLAVNPL